MKDFMCGLYKGLGFLLVCSAGMFLLAAVFMARPKSLCLDKFLLTPTSTTMSIDDVSVLKKMAAKGYIIESSTLQENILSYYNTLITILVALLGFSAIIGYFYVKGVSEEKAERKAEESVSKYFEKQTTHAAIKLQLETVASEWTSWMEEVDPIEWFSKTDKQIAEQQRKLEKLEEALEDISSASLPTEINKEQA